MEHNDFYIGWMAKAPGMVAAFIRQYLGLLIPLLLLLGVGLAGLQKKASTATFEFGQSTQLTGVFHMRPVPCLRILDGVGIGGTPLFQLIPLVGYGKSGAESIINNLEQKKRTSFEGRLVTLQGSLLYNDGKTILQIEDGDSTIRSISIPKGFDAQALEPIDLGSSIVKGEIADPKCFFGVMKPGEGKPHRDCAIRCILGGISPILVERNASGEANYLLLVGPHGERMNSAVRDFVAEPVSITGRRVQMDDWIILYADDTAGIRRNNYLSKHFGKSIASCGTSCAR